MQDKQQFEQLILQYEQLKNGAEDILQMIKEDDFDGAITMIKARESIFLNCKCMRKYLELTPEQEKTANELFEEIKTLEERNIEFLNNQINSVKNELKKTQKAEKIQMAYEFSEENKGNLITIQD